MAPEAFVTIPNFVVVVATTEKVFDVADSNPLEEAVNAFEPAISMLSCVAAVLKSAIPLAAESILVPAKVPVPLLIDNVIEAEELTKLP